MEPTSPTPPPSAPLTPEKVARITEWHRRLFANYEERATDETIDAAGLGGIGVLLDDMGDLLAERAAYREAVAAELRGLLPPTQQRLAGYDAPLVKEMSAHYEALIHSVAARLGLTL